MTFFSLLEKINNGARIPDFVYKLCAGGNGLKMNDDNFFEGNVYCAVYIHRTLHTVPCVPILHVYLLNSKFEMSFLIVFEQMFFFRRYRYRFQDR